MRGCLFVLVLAALVLVPVTWFGSPVLASTVVEAALDGAGFHGETLSVVATANPPPKLLLGRADQVVIESTGVSFRTFEASRLDLTLADVDLLRRTAATITGTIDGAEVTTADGVPTTADVRIDGSASAAAATIVVDGATVDRVVKATFQDEAGVAITRTELVAPDLLRIVTPAATIEGRLIVDGSGAIALSNALGESRILSLDPSFPLRLHGVRVEAGDVRIDATLDAEALLGG